MSESDWEPLKHLGIDSNPCQECGGRCCKEGVNIEQGKYVPGLSDQSIKWAECWEGVETYVYHTPLGKLWGIKIPKLQCKHIAGDGGCLIHDNKPSACKEYIGLKPTGPDPNCPLIIELLRHDKVPYEGWIKKLWPRGLPLTQWLKELGILVIPT